MRIQLRRPLAVATALAVLALAGNIPAFAASPSAVTIAGSSAPGTHAYDADSTMAISFVAGMSFTCSSVSLQGDLNSGSVAWAPPSTGGLGSIQSSAWNGCTGAGFNLAITQYGTWNLDITGDTVNGVTPVLVSNIDATVKDEATGGGLCAFTLTGTTPGTVRESNQTLLLNAYNLTVTPSPSCGGLVHGPLSFNGTFAITQYGVTPPAPLPIDITS